MRFLLLVLTLGTALMARGAASQRPNILFLITDDQRFDMMGNVTPHLVTPEMDRMAAEGVRFEQAFVTTPICMASRASMLTALHERTHRTTFITPPLARAFVEQSFPRLLRAAGYRTGYVGKFGVTVPEGSTETMFDSFVELAYPYWKTMPDGSRQHLTNIEGDRAVDFLRTHVREHGDRPFCLTVGFNAPHAEDVNPQQYIWPEEVDDLYRDLQIPPPPLSSPSFYNNLPQHLRDGTMNRDRWQWRFNFEPKRREMVRGYYRMISGVDRVIGRLRQTLGELGVDRNTVIILIGDNGYFLGERGYAGKWLPYDQAVHVPLLMVDPSGRFTKAGQRPTAMALNIDVPATILDLAGVPAPAAIQGRSLVPLARGESPANWRTDFFIEHLTMNPTIRKHEGVRNERFRYSRYFEAVPIIEELYDLRDDPWETINLINSPRHQAVVDELRRRTDELRDAYGGEFSARLWKETAP